MCCTKHEHEHKRHSNAAVARLVKPLQVGEPAAAAKHFTVDLT